MVKHLHLPHGGLRGRRLCSPVEDQGVAESNVAHAHVVRAGAAIELTKPAGIEREAFAGGYVRLGDKTAALFFGVLGNQVFGLVAQDLAALVLESLVGMETV